MQGGYKISGGFTPLEKIVNFKQRIFKEKHSLTGFTLIELLVSISIIALLIGIALINLNNARMRAMEVRVQSDLKQIRSAIALLETDTNLHPNKLSLSPCVQNSEIFLNVCEAGIQCTDGGFPNWNGPYISSVTTDPWRTDYYFDADYQCDSQTGCEGIIDGTIVRAILSFGPNGVENSGAGSDDIVLVLCR